MAAVVVIAHEPLATALVAAARHVYSRNALSPCRRLAALDIPPDGSFDALIKAAQAHIASVDGAANGVLILTDMLGATPANIAQHLAHAGSVSVLSGVNLPMLLRALCYSDRPLHEVEAKALDGGIGGILALPAGPPATADTAGRPLPPCAA